VWDHSAPLRIAEAPDPESRVVPVAWLKE